jgi:hypothetical protein
LTYKEVRLDISRLENEVRQSIPFNVDPNSFYWFLATEAGEKEDIRLRSRK